MFTVPGTMWIHNLGTTWLFTDGHAKVKGPR